MIVNCKECSNQISDKALVCPHCGITLKHKRTNSHMRLPNGFGQITKVKGNLRNPYRAMITVSKNEYGKPICKLLKPKAYFKTYNEAYEALMLHQTNPYEELPIKSILDLYTEWRKEYEKGKNTTIDVYSSSCWPRCKEIYYYDIKEVKPVTLKNFIESLDCSAHIKINTKSMFAMMYDYAMQYEYVDKNPARIMTLSNDIIADSNINKEHINFTSDELNIFWANIDYHRIIPVILVQCYMGWRPQEVCTLEIENVNINEWTIKGGMKTENGKNRVVPIHPRIRDIILKYYNNAKTYERKYLWTDDKGNVLPFNTFRAQYKEILDRIGIKNEHRPHDGRVTFVTNCKECGVDEYAIKYMVGHSIQDLTERVYTKRTIDWLHAEISKLE